MKRKNIWIIMTIIVALCGVAHAQGVRYALSGMVRDASNGESMMGVYVIMTDVSNASNVQGCVTNQAGYYSISSVSGTYKVTINHLGTFSFDNLIILPTPRTQPYAPLVFWPQQN